MKQTRKGLLVAALILLAGNPYWMTLNAQELDHADRETVSTSVDTTTIEPVSLPSDTPLQDTVPDSSSAAVPATFEEGATQVVPFEDIGSPASTEEVAVSTTDTDVTDESVEVEKESPSFFDKVWSYLGATADTTVERGKLYLEKRRVQSLYGEVNATEENLATILAQEQALKEADTIRQQR